MFVVPAICSLMHAYARAYACALVTDTRARIWPLITLLFSQQDKHVRISATVPRRRARIHVEERPRVAVLETPCWLPRCGSQTAISDRSFDARDLDASSQGQALAHSQGAGFGHVHRKLGPLDGDQDIEGREHFAVGL